MTHTGRPADKSTGSRPRQKSGGQARH
ncbi:hypothetical protein GA0115259_109811, partial [Streptomyces sp. MnatMP-M17]